MSNNLVTTDSNVLNTNDRDLLNEFIDWINILSNRPVEPIPRWLGMSLPQFFLTRDPGLALPIFSVPISDFYVPISDILPIFSLPHYTIVESFIQDDTTLDQVLDRSVNDTIMNRKDHTNVQLLRIKWKDQFKQKLCTICCDNFVLDDIISILKCRHVYHHNCIQEWCHYKTECPVCKRTIEEK